MIELSSRRGGVNRRAGVCLFALSAVCLFVSNGPAQAGSVFLDFNNLIGPSVSGTTWSNLAVQNSLQSIIPDITVTGSLGVVNYTGEGHVVGPNGVAATLQSIEHNKAFLTTLPIKSTTPNEIVFNFKTTKIYKISFDYEIFPDGSGVLPDFSFKADGKLVFRTFGAVPGKTQVANQGNPYANAYGAGGSTQSALSLHESSAQFVGYTGDIYFPDGVSNLEFIDWPPRIGIGNIHLDTSAVPEPASLTLMGFGLAGLAVGAFRRNRVASKT